MERDLHILLQPLRPFWLVVIDVLGQDLCRLAQLGWLVRRLCEGLYYLFLRFVVVNWRGREAAHHARGLHPGLLVVGILLISLEHRVVVALVLHVGVLAHVAAFLLVEVKCARIEAIHGVVVAVTLLDDDQVLHVLAVSCLHLSVGDVDCCVLPRAEGALRCDSVPLVLLIRRVKEYVALVFVFL